MVARHGRGSYVASAAVVSAAAGFLTFAAIKTGSQTGATDDFAAAFSSSAGLVVGSAVEVAGVKVGEVTSIDLDRRTFLANVRFTMARRVQVPADTGLTIQGGGFSGLAVVGVEPGSAASRLKAGSLIARTSPAQSLENEVGEFIFGNAGLADAD